MTVGYFGPHGTFSEQAALDFYGKDCNFEMLSTNQAVVEGVDSGEVDEGIVAFQNSYEGAVSRTQDALIAFEKVKVKAEFLLPIVQNLIVVSSEITLEQITEVSSHPQALSQCKERLRRILGDVEIVELAGGSTAQAVENLSSCGNGAAAIGSRAAAEHYGCYILAEGIQDGENNVTRFLALAREEDNPPTGQDKTSLIFKVLDRPGGLVDAIGTFKALHINMSNLQSRPLKGELGEAIFLVDIHGHREDPKVRVALEEMRQEVTDLRVLGSYPRTY